MNYFMRTIISITAFVVVGMVSQAMATELVVVSWAVLILQVNRMLTINHTWIGHLVLKSSMMILLEVPWQS